MNISRRQWLFCAALGARLRLRAASTPELPVFEEIPISASGITWVHDNAMSPMRYLPETMGPGCAFLDYDNDGWMDIFLVNSGRCDFYKPKEPLRNALYKNNRDGTFTDVTDKAGVAGGESFGMGVRGGRLRQRRLRRHFRNGLWPCMSLSQQRQRNVHRRHRKSRPWTRGL